MKEEDKAGSIRKTANPRLSIRLTGPGETSLSFSRLEFTLTDSKNPFLDGSSFHFSYETQRKKGREKREKKGQPRESWSTQTQDKKEDSLHDVNERRGAKHRLISGSPKKQRGKTSEQKNKLFFERRFFDQIKNRRASDELQPAPPPPKGRL